VGGGWNTTLQFAYLYRAVPKRKSENFERQFYANTTDDKDKNTCVTLTHLLRFRDAD